MQMEPLYFAGAVLPRFATHSSQSRVHRAAASLMASALVRRSWRSVGTLVCGFLLTRRVRAASRRAALECPPVGGPPDAVSAAGCGVCSSKIRSFLVPLTSAHEL